MYNSNIVLYRYIFHTHLQYFQNVFLKICVINNIHKRKLFGIYNNISRKHFNYMPSTFCDDKTLIVYFILNNAAHVNIILRTP